MISHVHAFESIAHFLQEYEAHLKHGGLILELAPAPALHSAIQLQLQLPPDQARFEVEARVVAQFPQGVAVQLEKMDEATRLRYEEQIERCRSLERIGQRHQLPVEAHQARPQPASPSRESESAQRSAPAVPSPPSSPRRSEKRQNDKRRTVPLPRSRGVSIQEIQAPKHKHRSRPRRHTPAPQSVPSSHVPTVPPQAPLPEAPPAPSTELPRPPLAENPQIRPFSDVYPSADGLPAFPVGRSSQGSLSSFESFLVPEEPLPPPPPPPPGYDIDALEGEILSPDFLAPGAFPPENTAVSGSRPDYVPPPPVADSSSWEIPPPPQEQLSLATADWSTVSYSYDSLPAAHYTPPPNSLPALTPTPSTYDATEESGELEPRTIIELLTGFAVEGKSGMLHLRLSDDRQRSLFLHKGSVIGLIENPPSEEHLLGEILFDLECISSKDRVLGLEAAKSEGIPLGEALINMSRATSREIGRALRRQLQYRIRGFLLEERGEYTFYERRLPSDNGTLAPPTSPIRLMFRGLIDLYNRRMQAEAKAIEMPFQGRFVAPTPEASGMVAACDFSKNELRFWNDLITGQFTLREVFESSPFSRKRTHSLIFALREIGLLAFQGVLGAALQRSEIEAMLEQRRQHMGEASYFDFLEIHWSASDDDITRACDRLEAQFSNCEGWPHDLIELSHELLQCVERAREHLLSPPENADEPQYAQLLFTANDLFTQARASLVRKEFATCTMQCNKVLALVPSLKGVSALLKEAEKAEKDHEKKKRAARKSFELKVDWERLSRTKKK